LYSSAGAVHFEIAKNSLSVSLLFIAKKNKINLTPASASHMTTLAPQWNIFYCWKINGSGYWYFCGIPFGL
jgi:hypothetical protein